MMNRMRSFAKTPGGRVPLSTILIVSGTLSHSCPVAIAAATSVEPTPVAKAFRAPAIQVWESVPMTVCPGLTSLSTSS